MRFIHLSVMMALACFSIKLNAQESGRILLMNGKYLEVINLNDTSYTFLSYSYDKNFYKRERADMREAWKNNIVYRSDFQGKKSQDIPSVIVKGTIERDEVFSFQSSPDSEKLYYSYDEPAGNYFEVEEMRAFIYGERDARNNVRGRGWFYGGLALGAITGYALETSVFSLAVPPLFALSTKIPIVKIKDANILDKKYRGDVNYAAGYESYTRSRNAIQALKGSALGTALGIIAFVIVDNN